MSDTKLKILDKLMELYRDSSIKAFRLFCDFSRITSMLEGLDTRMVDLRHVASIDRSQRHKNAADIAMAVDITKFLVNRQDIEKYVLVSSDSDMLPIITELIHNGKEVEVVCFKSGATGEVYQSVLAQWGVKCHMIEDILKLVKFEKMTQEDFQQNFYKIKGELAIIYGEYKQMYPHKVPSIKDIRIALEDIGYCKEDSADIIKFGFQKGIIETDTNETNGRIFRGIKINN